jgi:hypothetical protein
MGASVSTQVLNQNMSVVNEAMTEIVNESISSGTAKTVNANILSINLKGAKFDDCPIDMSQTIKAGQEVKVMAKFASTQELQSKIENALTQAASQQSQQKQDALSLSLGVSTGINNINQQIRNYTQTKVTNKTLTEVNAQLENLNFNNSDFSETVFKCKGKPLNFKQEIVSTQCAQILSDAIAGTAISQAQGNTVAQTAEQKSSQEQTGIAKVLGAFGLAIMLPLIICVVVIGIFLGPSLIKKMKFGFGRRRVRFGGRRW